MNRKKLMNLKDGLKKKCGRACVFRARLKERRAERGRRGRAGLLTGGGVLLVILAFSLFALLPAAAFTREQYGGIYQNTVRLHVLADSNEAQAQELKLLVRDRLLEVLEPELADCTCKKQAQERLLLMLPALREQAQQVLLENGCTLPVTISLKKEIYPVRVYDECTYPAGEYLSLRVLIGAGAGKNWWCVVYPPLCLSASMAQDEGYSGKEEALLTGKTKGYKLKFAFLELGDRIYRLFDR